MLLIYSVIPLMIIVGLMVIKKVSLKKIINGLFWGIISILITMVIDIIFLTPIFGTSSMMMLTGGDISLLTFIICLITAALPEETSKLLCIKFSTEKDKTSILINSILIGITFACIENFMYVGSYGLNLSLTRMLQPGHLFFQIIMSLFLIKSLDTSKNKIMIYNALAIIVPMFCHAFFNMFNSIEIISYIFYVIGILTYLATFYFILKLPTNNNDCKVKIIGLKIIVIVISILFVVIMNSQNTSANLNEIIKIQEDNIELKIINSEKVKINDDVFPGDYIKIKVQLKNNNAVSYITDSFHFHIVDSLNKNNSYLSFRCLGDCLYEIDAGETATGYLYFDDEGYNYTYLIYTTGKYGNTQTYSFNIK